MEKLILTNLSFEELELMVNKAVNDAVKNIKIEPYKEEVSKLLTRKETSDKLRISLVTLNDWSKRGLIKSYLIGGRVLYKENEIEEIIKKGGV